MMQKVCQTADLEIDRGYMKQVRIVGDDRSSRRQPLRPRSEGKFDKGDLMGQQSVRQAARRSALDAQAARRKERVDRERRLEGLAVKVLAGLGERDATIAATEQRAGAALQAMINDEHVTVADTAQWCAGQSAAVR
jgi:hypothetical protein